MTDVHLIGKFGKREKLEDVHGRTLQLARYLDPDKLAPLPLYREWSVNVPIYNAFLNFELGTCAIASLAHCFQTWCAANGESCDITDQHILDAYKTVGGYVPGRPETDQGCYMLEVLRYGKSHGLGGHYIQAYFEVDPRDIRQLRYGVELGGCLYAGFRLPLSARDEQIWTSTDGIAGAWGSHAMGVPNSSFHEFGLPTWTRVQRATVEWVHTFADEVYVPLPVSDWASGTRPAPNGLLLDKVMRDLERVTA